ncbi:GAF domain-containing protein [Nocardioides sp. CFH 31398]|uniref:GAF domain-containing protein n=1 Tax=Nocardioides sp. CFH 31398 TaxID=2919579 RepID=UPI001F06C2EF|nr:GAF domain-containing protein [Nocardioides sp. CFH 31398]MCH1868799.1 GAF domain-containing protein [Nocardioides sp. CFH 31398]
MAPKLTPIDATVRASREIDRLAPGLDVLSLLDDLAGKVEAVVPDCVGLSVAWFTLDLSFTLVASDDDAAALDAVQYLDGGPCVDDLPAGSSAARESRPLDEDRWLLFGRAAAARGVASTLTLPLLGEDGGVVGTVNLYAATPDAFEGRHERLAALIGGRAADAVRNADLSFTSRATSEQAPTILEAQHDVALAAALLARQDGITVAEAETRVRQAAYRAGARPEDVARLLLETELDGPGA